ARRARADAGFRAADRADDRDGDARPGRRLLRRPRAVPRRRARRGGDAVADGGRRGRADDPPRRLLGRGTPGTGGGRAALMLQLALRTLRFRTGTFVAAFIAMFFAAIVLMACGGLIETGIRAAVPPQQLGAADVVVAGEQTYHAPGGDTDEPAVLPERVRVDAGLATVIAALPGVQETDTYVFEGTPPAGTVDAIGVVAEPGTDVAELRTRIDAELGATTSTLVGDERGRAELRGATATSVNVVSLAGVF